MPVDPGGGISIWPPPVPPRSTWSCDLESDGAKLLTYLENVRYFVNGPYGQDYYQEYNVKLVSLCSFLFWWTSCDTGLMGVNYSLKTSLVRPCGSVPYRNFRADHHSPYTSEDNITLFHENFIFSQQPDLYYLCYPEPIGRYNQAIRIDEQYFYFYGKNGMSCSLP